MSKKMNSLSLPSALLLAGMFVTSVTAADRVVVIPLGSSSGKAVGNAIPSDVIINKTFSGDAGVGIIGTMPDIGAVTITPTTSDQAIPAGYHNGSGAVTGDPDLASANIKSGTNIFGVAGDSNVVDSSSGDAVSSEIMDGKKAWVDGSEITGSMSTTTQSLSDTSTTVAAGVYAATTLDTVDPDLASANIKSGTTIFGIAGDSHVVDTGTGDAVAGDILTAKKAWVDGVEVTGNVPAGTNVSGADGLKTFTISDGLYSGNKTATANDTNLAAGNIKSGTTIFGVTGTLSAGVAGGVAKTGQTTSYATGDDGDLQRGVTWPSPRFTDNNDGTVTDNLTGLMWLQNADCFGLQTWTAALTSSNTLNSGECGLHDGSVAGDWRLPNVKELQSLIDFAFDYPALSNDTGTGQWTEGSAFTGVRSSIYWSSTTYAAGNLGYAWHVTLDQGAVAGSLKSSVSRYVWPVRD